MLTMDSNVERRIILVMVKQIVIITAFFSVSLGQTVTVSMEPMYYSDPATTSATLTCDFSVDDGTYTFFNLEWRTNGDIVADFFNGATDPTYRSFCASSSACTITRTSSESNFIISSLNMTNNEDSFNCLVTFRKGAERRNNQDTALLVVVVPTKTIEMLNGSSSEMFDPDDSAYLSLDLNIFQCVVADINPQATFTWTVGEALPDSVIITESHVVDTGTGLTTSTSNATLTPDFNYNGEYLICKAVNYKGDPGVEFRLVLKVLNPCTDMNCNNGTCDIDTSDPSDPGKTKCTCAEGFTGDFCNKATGLSIGIIIGIVVGSLCVVVITVGVGIAILKYNSKNGVTPDSNQSKKGKKKEAIEEEHV